MPLIGGVTPVAAQATIARVPASTRGGFAMPPAASRPDARPGVDRTETAAAISSSMVLALQEQVGREHADEDARRHGRRLLEELAKLQRALLADGDAASLEGLAELTRADFGGADPALAGVLSSIRLRARIELARRSHGSGPV